MIDSSPADPTTSATWAEIHRQPRLWRTLAADLRAAAGHADFLAPVLERPGLRIVLTGAGTSAFVGEIAAPALARATGRRVEAVATTDIVSNPREVFAQDVPTLLVSVARSGNSPESVAATELADRLLSEVRHRVLTCAPDGALARAHGDRPTSRVVLMPEGSNDSGFAMTGSFTSQLLSTLWLLGPWPAEQVDALADAAEAVLGREPEIAAVAARRPERVVFLGSGPLRGLAHEAGLKFLELTAGDRVSFFESALGFRHGPKAVLDERTLAVVFVSADPYTRRYDDDIVAELRRDLGANNVVVLASDLPDPLAAAVHVVWAQLLAVHASATLGKNVDNPFPAGDVNRVVQGVVVHPLE